MLTFSILSKSHLANSVISKCLICHDMFSLFLMFCKLNFEVGVCSKLKQCAICCSMTEWRRERDPGINIYLDVHSQLNSLFSFPQQRELTRQMASCPQSHSEFHLWASGIIILMIISIYVKHWILLNNKWIIWCLILSNQR